MVCLWSQKGNFDVFPNRDGYSTLTRIREVLFDECLEVGVWVECLEQWLFGLYVDQTVEDATQGVLVDVGGRQMVLNVVHLCLP